MRLRLAAAALLAFVAAVVNGGPPAAAQIDTEEERSRAAAREEALQKKMPAWQYELYRRERDRNRLKDKTELDTLVEAARLFPLVGRYPPPFTLVRPDGRRVGLSDFTGHVIMLYFWTTDSPYTSEELPASVERLQRELRDRRFTVVAVNVKGKQDEVAQWVQSRGLSPVVLLDTNGGVADLYKVRSAPTVYLIDRDHKLVGRATGTRPWDEHPTRELIEYLLKAPAR